MSELWYWSRSRVISLAIASINVVLAYFIPSFWEIFLGGLDFIHTPIYRMLTLLFFQIVIPLPLIWFGDILDEGMPTHFHPRFNKFAGWFLLLLPDFLWLIYYFYISGLASFWR